MNSGARGLHSLGFPWAYAEVTKLVLNMSSSILFFVQFERSYSLPVRGLTELTREGEVPVWGVKWPVASVRSHSQPPRTCHVHAFRDDLGAINDRQ
jgi:hypothetical protein